MASDMSKNKHGFPPRSETEDLIIQIIKEHNGVLRIRDSVTGWNIYDELAARLSLSQEAMSRMTTGMKPEKAWRPEVGFCRKNLVERGVLEDESVSGRGIWKLKNYDERPQNIWPDDVNDEAYYEGAVKKVVVNLYERNEQARQRCIDHYGYDCFICDFSFERVYGVAGRNFIHVHHIKPLSEIGQTYKLDPIKDLRPVCPNCHAMIHRRNPPYSIDQMKKMFR